MKKVLLILASAMLLMAGDCSNKNNEPIVIDLGPGDNPEEPGGEPGDKPGEEPGEEPTINIPAFAKGADVSWVSEMEKGGKIFRNAAGSNADIFDVLKETGVNAIRLRVWVDPYKGWSAKDDMTALAERATNAGLPVMVDFHYSDFFTDPSRQNIPEAWAEDAENLNDMVDHVTAYTKEVMEALKAKGVSPKWVQVGNETKNGMLWPAGKLWATSGESVGGWAAFTKLYMAGYNTVKAIFPEALVLPHLQNAYDDNAWWFTELKNNGGKFDLIGLSHYPQTNSKMTWENMNSTAASRINALGNQFKVDVMVVEVGVKFSDITLGAEVLQDFVDRLKNIDACAGVFYWEPEVYGWWKPAVYSDAAAIKKYTGKSETWNAYDMGAFGSTGAPSPILDAFKD